jgi:D-alanyl-D-alanine dipeptidase
MNRLLMIAAAVGVVTFGNVGRATELTLVEIKKVDPTIVIDLRYATPKNITRRALYPADARAFILPSVAEQLTGAQKILHHYDFGLKIWDAYRPKEAQELLWKLAGKGDYVANPEGGIGSTHSWGVSVDATLVDRWGREMTMPSAFDEFTPAAMMYYQGSDPLVRGHLRLLQFAMASNNFYGLRIEWWHFTTADWQKYVPATEVANQPKKNSIDNRKLKAVSPASQNPKT